MKQIFDWLREQMDKEYNHYMRMADYTEDEELRAFKHGVSKGLDMAHGFINEAEAKWESECCIRVVGKPFTSSCGQKYDKWTYVGEPYCAKCGKPIKISEVE